VPRGRTSAKKGVGVKTLGGHRSGMETSFHEGCQGAVVTMLVEEGAHGSRLKAAPEASRGGNPIVHMYKKGSGLATNKSVGENANESILGGGRGRSV